ncbi:MAG: ribosomal protein S18-alanine N-acetyltransferase [Eubacteriaceae bacterium]|nr:ribosomal protein S18-alanine N-acetyltransferase [Eubacteriaceae bacterium]
MTVVLRKMKISDLYTIEKIESLCQLGTWTMDSYLHEIRNPIARYIVAERDDQILGFAGAWCVVDEVQIMKVGVLPNYQGSGLGTMLMRALDHIAMDEQCKQMTLEVKENNTKALNLYKKMGFFVSGHRSHYYPDGMGADLMTKILISK